MCAQYLCMTSTNKSEPESQMTLTVMIIIIKIKDIQCSYQRHTWLRRSPSHYLAWCMNDNRQGTWEFPARLLTWSPLYSCLHIFQNSFHESAVCTHWHSGLITYALTVISLLPAFYVNKKQKTKSVIPREKYDFIRRSEEATTIWKWVYSDLWESGGSSPYQSHIKNITLGLLTKKKKKQQFIIKFILSR